MLNKNNQAITEILKIAYTKPTATIITTGRNNTTNAMFSKVILQLLLIQFVSNGFEQRPIDQAMHQVQRYSFLENVKCDTYAGMLEQ